MPRPQITVNGGAPGVKGAVAAGSTVTLALDDTTGVRSTAWRVLSTDETAVVGDYPLTVSGSVNQQATFTAGAAGTALVVEAKVNGGLVQARTNLAETVATVKVYVATTDGYEVGATGEAYESDPVNGTTGIINTPVRALAGYSASISTVPSKVARASAVANLALSGIPASGDTDGVTLVAGDTVLLTNQSAPAQNGLWTVAAGAWSRPPNFSSSSGGDVRANVIFVIAGTLRAGWVYQVTNTAAVTIDTTAITLARFSDRFDRATLAAASSTPSNDALAKYNGSGQLVANAFVSGTGTPAGSGLLRASSSSVAVAFKSALTAGDYAAVSSDVSDNLTIGGGAWASVVINADATSSVDFLLGAVRVVSLTLNRFIFDQLATMRFVHANITTGNGQTTSIEAQGSGGGEGGSIELIVGAGTTLPGDVRIDLGKSSGDVTGNFFLAGDTLGDLFQMFYDGGQPGWFVSANDAFDFTASNFFFNAFSISLVNSTSGNGRVDVEAAGVAFGGGGSYGTGQRVVFVANATTNPTTNPVGGFILYADAGAAKVRGSSGTVTTIGPAEPHCTACGRDFALEWRNDEKSEHLAVCLPCMLTELTKLGAEVDRFAFAKSLKSHV